MKYDLDCDQELYATYLGIAILSAVLGYLIDSKHWYLLLGLPVLSVYSFAALRTWCCADNETEMMVPDKTADDMIQDLAVIPGDVDVQADIIQGDLDNSTLKVSQN